jgi:23S rRNA (uracil1939-C5)-methyltransferase
VDLTIERVGARGDGIGHHDGEPVFVPFTVPGDRVRVRLGPKRGEGRAAALLDMVAAGPGRRSPPCAQFGRCGGCTLQHLDDDLYATAKLDALRAAMRRHGLDSEAIAPLHRVPPGTRRRARLSLARRGGKAVVVGFNARESHDVVDLAAGCAVLHPALATLVEPLRGLGASVLAPGEKGAVSVTLTETGIDALVDLPRPPDMAALEALAAFAEARDLARLAWSAPGCGEPVPAAVRRQPRAVIANVAVDLPTGGFLQAAAEGEAALAAAVLDAVGAELPRRRVGDLFAGVGTFTFALAGRGAAVHAVEGAAPAVAALKAAAGRSGLAGRVTAERRDLDARPLLVDELRRFDAVVFDPPRAGAAAQAASLAQSHVPRVAAVSCNPATFARDARLLVDGGYRLRWVRPVDQFVWSAHLELVAAFDRGPAP